MPGDYSRFTDDSKKHYSRLRMQQGRVLLDSDWNEQAEIFTERDRVQVRDIIGRAAIPRFTTKDGFKITITGGNIFIEPGHAYVDGILVESHKKQKYSEQEFFPNPPQIQQFAGLLYLDVWEREITALEDPLLLDDALGGVDTTTRIQTIWQVKHYGGQNCKSDLDALLPPSTGRLSVKVDVPKDPKDPCLLPETGGLRDLENRFYRVQIHGNAANPTPPKFKFSRDPVATRIDKIDPADATKITVRSLGPDASLRFSPGDWVEITNDRHVLNETPGVMANIKDADPATLVITLDRAIAAAEINDPTYPARLIRWDQRKGNGVNLDADGLITATGNLQTLERGIQVKLEREGNTGSFHHGDTWYFPTRVATGKAGPLEKAPPREIRHHYCALATINDQPVVIEDCRTLWPPEPVAGEDCECASCVTEEQHAKETKTIQQAINEAVRKGGGIVCLGPGFYLVRETISILSTWGITLRGHGRAFLYYVGKGPAIRIESSVDCGIENVWVYHAGQEGPSSAIHVKSCLLDTFITDCILTALGGSETNPSLGIQVEALVVGLRVVNNTFIAGVGVGTRLGIESSGVGVSRRSVTTGWVFGEDLEIRENAFCCRFAGIALAGLGLAMDIVRNWMELGTDTADDANTIGILLIGVAYEGGAINIDNNRIFTQAAGIEVTTSATTISNNSITSTRPPSSGDSELKEETRLRHCGIIIDGFAVPPDTVKILGNRLSHLRGHGIVFNGNATSAMVKQNSISDIGGSGIITTTDSSVERLSIENNDIVGTGVTANASFPAAGIRVGGATDVEIAHNHIQSVSSFSRTNPARGIHVLAPQRVRIEANSVQGIQASFDGEPAAAIEISASYKNAQIVNNTVLLERGTKEGSVRALRIDTRTPKGTTAYYAVALPLATATAAISDPKAKDLQSGAAFVAKDWTFGTGYVVFFPDKALEVHAKERALIVRANVLHLLGDAFVPPVDIRADGTATFGANDVRVVDNRTALAVLVILESETAIFDSNHVLGAKKDLGSGGRTAVEIKVNAEQWTILGNIIQNGIQVNSSSVSADYLKLNRLLS